MAYACLLIFSSFVTARDRHSPFFQCISLLFERCAFWGLHQGGQRIFLHFSKQWLPVWASFPLRTGLFPSWNTYLLVTVDIGHHRVPSTRPVLSLQQGLLHTFCWPLSLLPPLMHVADFKAFHCLWVLL